MLVATVGAQSTARLSADQARRDSSPSTRYFTLHAAVHPACDSLQ
jgi:hypothetical protein